MECLYQGQQQMPPIQPFALFPDSPLLNTHQHDTALRHMLSLDLKDGTSKDMLASSATVGGTEFHLYKAGTSLTGTRQWSQIPSYQFPHVLVALCANRKLCLAA